MYGILKIRILNVVESDVWPATRMHSGMDGGGVEGLLVEKPGGM